MALILSGKMNRANKYEERLLARINRNGGGDRSQDVKTVTQFSLAYSFVSEVIPAHSVGRLPMPPEFVIVLRESVERVVEFNPNVLVEHGVDIVR
jgi:hypothetical protein